MNSILTMDNHISVIVPVYNIKQYLDPCIKSILASSYEDFELILVDDGSTDGSGAMCDAYAIIDNRIVVIHKENGGLSSARNAGMDRARGGYLLFVDGDDVIHPLMLETLYQSITSGDYDFSMIHALKVNENGYDKYLSVSDFGFFSQLEITRYLYVKKLFDLGTIQYQIVCNKLYKRVFVENLSFKTVAAEDLEWCNRMCQRINKGVVLEIDMYYYVQRDGSIMHQSIDASYILKRMDTFQMCLDNIPVHDKKHRSLCLKAMYWYYLYFRYLIDNKTEKKVLRPYTNYLLKKTGKELICSRLSVFHKIITLLLTLSPGLYSLGRRVKKMITK